MQENNCVGVMGDTTLIFSQQSILIINNEYLVQEDESEEIHVGS